MLEAWVSWLLLFLLLLLLFLGLGLFSSRRVAATVQEVLEMLVVFHRLLQVFWGDANLAVLVSLFASQLQDVGREVLEDPGQEHRGGGAQALSIAVFSQVAVHAAHRELQLSFGGAGDGLPASPTGFLGGPPPMHDGGLVSTPRWLSLIFLLARCLSSYHCSVPPTVFL